MPLRDDERGQAIQIGAVLLFAVLVIVFSLYQAFVVPNQNERVEANHLQIVEGEFHDIRDSIVTVPRTGDGRSVSVTLGTNYPARALALNPPPASGRLRTVGINDDGINVTVAHAKAIDEETADYWNGANRTRATGNIVYQPDFTEFRDPPDLVYDTTALVSRFDDANLWTSGQTLVDGRQLTVVALDGGFDRSSSRTVSLDVGAVSASTTDVAITNETGENVTVQFTSQRNASAWRSLLLEEEQFANQSGYVVNVVGSKLANPSFNLVAVELLQNETYTLRMAKVGVGTQATDTQPTYLTAVGQTTVSVNETFTVEVRDEFNNPVSGVDVTPVVTDGNCDLDTKQSDNDGRVGYRCESPGEVRLQIGSLGYETVNVTISASLGGDGEDTIGPATTAVTVSETSFSRGEQLDLNATIDDTGRGGTDIRAAEWFRTGPNGSVSNRSSMTVVDGQWDQPIEDVEELDIDTSSWEIGNHTISVLGQDYNGNWGPLENVTVSVEGVSGDALPNATIVSITDNSKLAGNNGQGQNYASFDVEWSVSDDKELESVEVKLIDSTGTVVANQSSTVGGTTASDTTTVEEQGGYGEEYTIEVSVTDSAGQMDTASITDTADSSDP